MASITEKKGEEDWGFGMGEKRVAVLSRVGREGLTESFKQRTHRREGVNHRDSRVSGFQQEERARKSARLKQSEQSKGNIRN